MVEQKSLPKVMGGFWCGAVHDVGTIHRQKNLGNNNFVGRGERQEEVQGNWQKERPFKQDLKLVHRGRNLSFDGS